MKCIPQTEPVSAIRAANGPWYQSVSKVSIPWAQTSWRPVAQWAATKVAAAERQKRLGKGDRRGRRRPGRRRVALYSAVWAEKSAPHAEIEAQAEQQGGWDQHSRHEDAEGAQQLEQDGQQRYGEDCFGEACRCSLPARQQSLPQADSSHRHRDRDQCEPDDAEGVIAEAH